jgi:hypothetical protein
MAIASGDAIRELTDALVEATAQFRRATMAYEKAIDQLAKSTAAIQRMITDSTG